MPAQIRYAIGADFDIVNAARNLSFREGQVQPYSRTPCGRNLKALPAFQLFADQAGCCASRAPARAPIAVANRLVLYKLPPGLSMQTQLEYFARQPRYSKPSR